MTSLQTKEPELPMEVRQPISILEVIAQAARDDSVDVEKMRALERVCPEHCEHDPKWMRNNECVFSVGTFSEFPQYCGHRCTFPPTAAICSQHCEHDPIWTRDDECMFPVGTYCGHRCQPAAAAGEQAVCEWSVDDATAVAVQSALKGKMFVSGSGAAWLVDDVLKAVQSIRAAATRPAAEALPGAEAQALKEVELYLMEERERDIFEDSKHDERNAVVLSQVRAAISGGRLIESQSSQATHSAAGDVNA